MKDKLGHYFGDVLLEWSISSNSNDAFRHGAGLYEPRLDIAVGPFNTNLEDGTPNLLEHFASESPDSLKDFVHTKHLRENINPRCLIAIEVVCSGSNKHILGDIANSSLMGLYGFVVTNQKNLEIAKRILSYIRMAQAVGKAPTELFKNVAVLSYEEMVNLL